MPRVGLLRTKLSTRGQITLPKELRQELGLNEGDEIQFVREGNSTYLLKPLKQEGCLDSLRGAWEGKGISTDEFIQEVRGEP